VFVIRGPSCRNVQLLAILIWKVFANDKDVVLRAQFEPAGTIPGNVLST
jgi:hypothetical protein